MSTPLDCGGGRAVCVCGHDHISDGQPMQICLECDCLDWRSNKVSCITCSVEAHPANMVNVYDGEYQCQECRWGL